VSDALWSYGLTSTDTGHCRMRIRPPQPGFSAIGACQGLRTSPTLSRRSHIESPAGKKIIS